MTPPPCPINNIKKKRADRVPGNIPAWLSSYLLAHPAPQSSPKAIRGGWGFSSICVQCWMIGTWEGRCRGSGPTFLRVHRKNRSKRSSDLHIHADPRDRAALRGCRCLSLDTLSPLVSQSWDTHTCRHQRFLFWLSSFYSDQSQNAKGQHVHLPVRKGCSRESVITSQRDGPRGPTADRPDVENVAPHPPALHILCYKISQWSIHCITCTVLLQ